MCSAPQPRGGWSNAGTEGFYKGFIGTQGGIWKDHEKMLGFIEGLWGPYKLGWGPFGGPNGAVGSAGLLCSAPHPNGGSYVGTEGCYKGLIGVTGTHGGIWKDHKKMLRFIEGLWDHMNSGMGSSGSWGPYGAVGICVAFLRPPTKGGWRYGGTEGFYKGFIGVTGTRGGTREDREKATGVYGGVRGFESRTQQQQHQDDDEHHEGRVAVGHRQPHQARLEDLLPSLEGGGGGGGVKGPPGCRENPNPKPLTWWGTRRGRRAGGRGKPQRRGRWRPPSTADSWRPEGGGGGGSVTGSPPEPQ